MPEEEFVEKVLENQPVPPRYFATMKRLNRTMEKHAKNPECTRLTFAELERAVSENETIVDTRSAEKFASGHIPGTLNIPLGKSFLNWLGALVDADRTLYLIVESQSDESIEPVLGDLCKIGMMNVAGYFGSDLVQDWKSRRGAIEKVRQIDVAGLQAANGKNGAQVIDVRSPDEWSHGHIVGAKHIPLASLPDRIGEIDATRPIVLQCRGGGRSAIATSLLLSRGISNVSNLLGGYDAWVAQRLPTETPSLPKKSKRS
jgi:hydroxyacylglutathione hydrolase